MQKNFLIEQNNSNYITHKIKIKCIEELRIVYQNFSKENFTLYLENKKYFNLQLIDLSKIKDYQKLKQSFTEQSHTVFICFDKILIQNSPTEPIIINRNNYIIGCNEILPKFTINLIHKFKKINYIIEIANLPEAEFILYEIKKYHTLFYLENNCSISGIKFTINNKLSNPIIKSTHTENISIHKSIFKFHNYLQIDHKQANYIIEIDNCKNFTIDDNLLHNITQYIQINNLIQSNNYNYIYNISNQTSSTVKFIIDYNNQPLIWQNINLYWNKEQINHLISINQNFSLENIEIIKGNYLFLLNQNTNLDNFNKFIELLDQPHINLHIIYVNEKITLKDHKNFIEFEIISNQLDIFNSKPSISIIESLEYHNINLYFYNCYIYLKKINQMSKLFFSYQCDIWIIDIDNINFTDKYIFKYNENYLYKQNNFTKNNFYLSSKKEIILFKIEHQHNWHQLETQFLTKNNFYIKKSALIFDSFFLSQKIFFFAKDLYCAIPGWKIFFIESFKQFNYQFLVQTLNHTEQVACFVIKKSNQYKVLAWDIHKKHFLQVKFNLYCKIHEKCILQITL